MVYRVGISIDSEDLKYVNSLQQQFHIKNRSEFFRELVKRYGKLEKEFKSLQSCLTGYLNQPENTSETKAILKSTLKNKSKETW